MCPLGWSKKHVIIESVVIVIPLAEFNRCFLELEYVNNHTISWICKWQIIVRIEPLKSRHDAIKLDLTIPLSSLCHPFGVLTLIWAFNPCLLHSTWLGCIRSCIEDTSHGFLVSRWVVHDRLMDMGNPIEIIVHQLLIGGMNYLGHWDGFSMVSALMYVMQIGQDLWWIMMHGYQLSWFTKLLYYMDC